MTYIKIRLPWEQLYHLCQRYVTAVKQVICVKLQLQQLYDLSKLGYHGNITLVCQN